MEHEALFEGWTLNPNLRCRTLKSLVPLPSRKSALSRRTARCEVSSRWSPQKITGWLTPSRYFCEETRKRCVSVGKNAKKRTNRARMVKCQQNHFLSDKNVSRFIV